MDWFLYNRDLRHERVEGKNEINAVDGEARKCHFNVFRGYKMGILARNGLKTPD